MDLAAHQAAELFFEGIAEGIQKAVNMPLSERRDRYHAMIDVLRENSIDAWRRRFIETLRGVTR